MKVKSGFCRICVATCGVKVSLSDDDRIVDVRADRDHPLSAGHICFKGIQSAATHNSANRILHTQKRTPGGDYLRIPVEDALDEIAAKLTTIRDRFGPDAIALYKGGPAHFNTPLAPMMVAFRDAVGTNNFYSSVTIDQPGKLINPERLGMWAAGKVPLTDSNVVMFVGSNPMLSYQVHGCITADPVKRMKRARAGGTTVIVIDPRRTETAAFADIHLQPRPGEDVSTAAGLIRLIFELGNVDQAFCQAHVAPGHLEALRRAVEPFTPAYVAERAGVSAAALRDAAAAFSQPGAWGSVFSGTGPAMGAHGSLAEHLLEVINVICGRYRRVGHKVLDIFPLNPKRPVRAQVSGPARSWENLPPSRIRGIPALWGERLTCNLADEINTPGPGQIRALINAAGNIASAIPDQVKVVKALRSLDLLVSIEPFWTTSARISDYVFAPKLQYERADIPHSFPSLSMIPEAWSQYQPAIASPPAGAEVVDEWHVFLGLARRMGLPLTYAGTPIADSDEVDTDLLLEYCARGSVVPLADLKAGPANGQIFDIAQKVEPPDETAGAFHTMPDDVRQELEAVAAEPPVTASRDVANRVCTHRFAVRRERDLLNSQGIHVDEIRARAAFNPAYLHPDDLEELGMPKDARVQIASRTGAIEAVVRPDAGVRRGVVMMSHGWGGLPDEPEDYFSEGANTNRLIDGDRDLDVISAIARMTGFPVTITPL